MHWTDEELDAVRAVLNAVRAKDGFESLSEDDLERLRASVRRGLGDETSRRAARELTQMAQEDDSDTSSSCREPLAARKRGSQLRKKSLLCASRW